MKGKRAARIVLLWLLASAATAREVDGAAITTAHNRWRAEVGVPPLQYSSELAVSAQAWADELKRKRQCRMQHSQTEGRYGENLYWASPIIWTDGRRELNQIPPRKPVDSWGGEKRDYNHASNSCRSGKVCGHYTQLVWKTTTHVGCAMAVCEDSREQVWVCQYQPAGNIVGRRPY